MSTVVDALNELHTLTKRLHSAAGQQREMAARRRALIAGLRDAGVSWGAIGTAMGATDSAAKSALNKERT